MWFWALRIFWQTWSPSSSCWMRATSLGRYWLLNGLWCLFSSMRPTSSSGIFNITCVYLCIWLAFPGLLKQSGKKDRQGIKPLRLLLLASTMKPSSTYPLSWPSTTSGGQSSSMISTMDDQTFGREITKRYEIYSMKRERAHLPNPCTKQDPNPSLRCRKWVEPQLDLICHRCRSYSAQVSPLGHRSSPWSRLCCLSHGGHPGPSSSWDLPTKPIPTLRQPRFFSESGHICWTLFALNQRGWLVMNLEVNISEGAQHYLKSAQH